MRELQPMVLGMREETPEGPRNISEGWSGLIAALSMV
jgi:hypothetical protein